MPRIVIDIDENMYQKIKGMETLILKNRAYKSLELAVLEGTVLPEHHGDLIDRNEYFQGSYNDAREFLDNTPTIIPATETPTERG